MKPRPKQKVVRPEADSQLFGNPGDQIFMPSTSAHAKGFVATLAAIARPG